MIKNICYIKIIEFSGDESIDENTGEQTKLYKSRKTMIITLSSIPVLLLLIGSVVGTFFGVEEYKRYFIKNYRIFFYY